jgi:transposase, IS5 family
LVFLDGRFGEVYTDDPGHPPLPTRLMAGLSILKPTYDLSDEVQCERWVENPYYLPILLRRGVLPALGGVRSIVADTLAQPHGRGAAAGAASGEQGRRRPDRRDQAVRASRVIVDTTVQPKNVTFPTKAKLLNRARDKLTRLAKLRGAALCASPMRGWASSP